MKCRLPSFASNAYDDLQEIAKFYFILQSGTKQMARLRGGFLLKKIYDDFFLKSKSKLKQTFIIYSAHDTTIIRTLMALGLYDVC